MNTTITWERFVREVAVAAYLQGRLLKAGLFTDDRYEAVLASLERRVAGSDDEVDRAHARWEARALYGAAPQCSPFSAACDHLDSLAVLSASKVPVVDRGGLKAAAVTALCRLGETGETAQAQVTAALDSVGHLELAREFCTGR